MNLKVFTLSVFLLYFWYMTWFNKPLSLPKPQKSFPSSPKVPLPQLVASQNSFQFWVDHILQWEAPLPQHYTIYQQQFAFQDACYGQSDGSLVSATGPALYEYLMKDKLVSFPKLPSFEANASSLLQNKHVFYFACLQHKIQSVHMCPVGHFFHEGKCQLIDRCVGQRDGMHFSDPYDLYQYYECQKEKAVLRSCPANQLFLHDTCRDKNDVSLYCQFHTTPKVLDSHTLLVCRQGQAVFETCPPGFQYFDSPKCESNACVGQPDQHKVPLPKVQQGLFTFVPGFMQCQNDKVAQKVVCPHTWDPYLSAGDNLTHLPQVFDGRGCSIPEFCTNVTSDEALTIVPAHHFTKHVRNWKYSEQYDAVFGYQCRGIDRKRKRFALNPGYHIHPKRFKVESACDGTVSKAVLANNHEAYFDCQTQTVVACDPNHFFNGLTCQPRIPHAHEFNGLGLFRLDTLRPDNWMGAWEYSKEKPVKPCPDSEPIYLETYNVCSHSDCTLYPFLTQIPFQIKLRNGTLCRFETTDRRLVNEPAPYPTLFWAQREVDQVPSHEPCVPGQHLQTGHIVFDLTLYATCDESQPFVFCPSSNTQKIEQVEGKRWACVPKDMEGILPPHTKVSFMANEVKRIYPMTPPPNRIKMNHSFTNLPLAGLNPQQAFHLDTLEESVAIEYQYRVTYPPDVAWTENGPQRSRNGGGFLVKLLNFTQRPINLPMHKLEASVPDFTLDGKP